MMHKEVYGGRMASVLATSEKWDSIDTYDYYTREEFAVRNAGVTAEGAIAVAVKEYEGSLLGSSCLVVGYGRIGRALAQVLRAMGGSVTASARRPCDFAWIELSGCTAIATDSIGHGHRALRCDFQHGTCTDFPAPCSGTVGTRLRVDRSLLRSRAASIFRCKGTWDSCCAGSVTSGKDSAPCSGGNYQEYHLQYDGGVRDMRFDVGFCPLRLVLHL